MLQEKEGLNCSQDYHPTQELKQYSKPNHSLRKKPKEKDSKIHQLFGYIQEADILLPPHLESNITKNHSMVDRHNKLTLSQNRKKEKENKQSQIYEQFNIFKHPSINTIAKINKYDIRLPSLEKKTKSIFLVDECSENPQKKAKVLRVPLQRLKPIDSQEIKKRFSLKYPRLQNIIQ